MTLFLLLTKRNFKKLSFIFILLLIPAVTLVASFMTKEEGTVMNIGYVCDGTPDVSTLKVLERLEQEDSMMSFYAFGGEDDGRASLESGDTDVLWIFPEDIEEAVKMHVSGEAHEVVRILQRKDDALSQMAREKLFCIIYPLVARAVFDNYMTNSLPVGHRITEAQLDKYYAYKGISGDIVKTVTVDSSGIAQESSESFLLSPIKGMLAVIVMLSGLAAALYTLSDSERGVLAVLSPAKRTVFCITSILSAVLPASVAVAMALLCTDGKAADLLRLLPFATACISLGLLLMGICRTTGALGGVIPVFTLLSLIFSPIFFNVNTLKWVQVLFPTYHYLYSVGDGIYLLYLAVYTLLAGIAGVIMISKRES